jgi:hypothetical protein
MDILSQIGPLAKLSMLVSLLPLVVAIAYAARPTERTLTFMRPASLATIFAAICSFAVGAALMCQVLEATAPSGIDMRRVYAGLAETCVPVIVGFGFLAVSWLLIAAGMLRRTP